MFTSLKEFVEPLEWFLILGASDTKHIRSELQDLLHHTSQSLKSLIELSEVLEDIPRESFDLKSFGPVYTHCRSYFTSPDGAQEARTHCTDIVRDINRINFKVAKYLRTEWGTWKGLNRAFEKLENADSTFLEEFEKELTRIDDQLREIFHLVESGKGDEAWNRYQDLRLSVLKGRDNLRDELKKLSEAERHIRRILT
jgi:hypothetical protein